MEYLIYLAALAFLAFGPKTFLFIGATLYYGVYLKFKEKQPVWLTLYLFVALLSLIALLGGVDLSAFGLGRYVK